MRLAVLALILLTLTFPFIGFSNAKDNGGDQSKEHFPSLMFLVIQPVGSAIATVEPLGHYSFKFVFYNGGYFQANLYAFWTEFRVEVEGQGWNAYVEPANTYFYPGEKKYGVVNVEAGARPSNFAYIHLYGRFRDIYGFWHHGNYTFQVRTTQYHSFDARIEDVFINAKQDDIYSVPITVRNFGNYEDRFYLQPQYIPAGWKITFSDPVLIIPPGGKATTYIYFATPHESVYLQHTTYLIRIEVGAEGTPPKLVAMIVSMGGFNFTPAQILAFLTIIPSLFVFAVIWGFSSYYKNLCNFLHKPWKEERESLNKLNEDERKKVMREMKEEWLSARYYCMDEYKWQRELEKLRKKKEKKEARLKKKIIKSLRKSEEEAEKVWRREVEAIKEEYEKGKRRIDKLLKEVRRYAEIKVTFPEPEYPAKPKKLIYPDIPHYYIDERRLVLIEPDEVSIKRTMMAVRNNKMIIEGEKKRIEKIGREIRNRLRMQVEAIEKKIDAELNKIKMERERKEQKEKILREIKK